VLPHLLRWKERVLQAKNILLVAHYDADGVSSAITLSLALDRLGKDYDVIVLRQLYREDLMELPLNEYDLTFFLDLGGRFSEKALVIDQNDVEQKANMLHPLQLGYDPNTEASSSTLTYLFSSLLVEVPAFPSLVGASGDRQFVSGRFAGLNREVVLKGVRRGEIMLYRDFVLPGVSFLPLYKLLYYSTEPLLPGLSNNPDGVAEVIDRAGLWGGERYTELTAEEKREFVSELVVFLLSRGWGVEEVRSLIGETYSSGMPLWLSTVRSAVVLFNALGKTGNFPLLFEIVKGEHSLLDRAERILARYRKAIFDAIDLGRRHAKDMGPYVFFDGRGEIEYFTSGAVASVLHAESGKPAVVAVEDGGYVKLSIRGGERLGETVSGIAERLGGEGGGHSTAAGARVPADLLDSFLDLLAEHLPQHSYHF